MGNDSIPTVRHGEAIELRSIRADLENHPERLMGGTAVVLHEVVDRLVDQYIDVCAHIAEDVEEIDDMVFDDEQPASVALFSDVRDHLLKVIDQVELMNELIDAVPTMVAGIYGMNFDHMPELRRRYDYFIVVGLLVLVCATLFRLFRKYEWL